MTGILQAVLISQLPVQPLFNNTQQHHITLAYGVDREPYNDLIGLPVTVAVVEICSNESIQAAQVILPNWIPCKNPIPHITISWIDGSAPIRANEMLQGEYLSEAPSVDHGSCIIEWLEWGDTLDPRNWAPRAYTLCPTCLRQGVETKVRSMTGYCRRHRNVKTLPKF
jgi:hypothetical protein